MNTFRTRSIQQNNRTGTFSVKADYTPMDDGNVRVDECVWDSMGIIPNGVESKVMPLAEAQAEYRERMANGWTT
jgi:hypothetical protein